jgi:hypothetical protein
MYVFYLEKDESMMLPLSPGFVVYSHLHRLQASGFRLQASGFRLQASGFRLQASGMGSFYIRVNVKALVTDSITK